MTKSKIISEDYSDMLKEQIKKIIDFYTFKENDLLQIKSFIMNYRRKNYDTIIDDMLDSKITDLLEKRVYKNVKSNS